MSLTPSRRAATVAAVAALGLTAACGSGSGSEEESASSGERELSGSRVVVATDEGVVVLERDTLEPVGTVDSPQEFVRLNPAGDGRHVFVSTESGFEVLDTGARVEAHGDHSHVYAEADPEMTGATVEAQEPGHVTIHDGVTALFSDGEGTIQLASTEDPAEITETIELPDPHHGVAVQLGENLLHTEGTADSRSSVVLRDAEGEEIARTDECPGVHGEATAADGVAVVGCEDGVVVVRGDEIVKLDSPDDYGRIGNQAGSDASPVVLGDYKTDADAELERPERISLIDTETDELNVVDLGTSYSFRSLGRGGAGEALVLGTDGVLHVLDETDGSSLAEIDVIDEWREPVDWQQPRPTLEVAGDTAWVTDPRTSQIHEIDLITTEVVQSVELPGVPNEIVAAG